MEQSQATKPKSHLSKEQVRGLLEDESQNLYDYLMRMTGQMERSMETCEEVVRVVTKWFEKDPEASFKTLRKKFYMTARSFNADIWEGDVENLQNSAYAENQDYENGPLREQFLQLETFMNSISGIDREIILLKYKYGFDTQEIKELTKLNEEVDPLVSRVLATLTSHTRAADIREQVASMPLHPKPESVTHPTQALSQLMRNLKSRRQPNTNLAIIFGGLAVAGVLLFIIKFIFFG